MFGSFPRSDGSRILPAQPNFDGLVCPGKYITHNYNIGTYNCRKAKAKIRAKSYDHLSYTDRKYLIKITSTLPSNNLNIYLDVSVNEDTACCVPLSAECVACVNNQTVEQYCLLNPNCNGCPGKFHTIY